MTEQALVGSGLLPFIEQDRPVGGIVHVGANDGAEIEWYLSRGKTPVLCFEPHPAAYQRALERWPDHISLMFVPCALGAEDGTLVMRVPADGDDEKTSRYAPIPTPGHDWTSVPLAESIEVPVVRFDTWIREHPEIAMQRINTLVVDVQGMELEVLEGFGVYLEMFDFLCLELSAVPVYDGEASAAEVEAWLLERRFTRATKIVEHGDVCFTRM